MSIINVSFNNLITNISCCTEQGYIIYNLNPSLEKKLYNEVNGGVGIVKMLNKTNILILVGGGTIPFRSKDTLILWDQLSKQNLIEIDMREPIKNALINKDKIISVLDKKVCIFDWSGMLLDTKVTYANEKGLCVMNMNLDVIAMLGTKKGEIAIWKYASDMYKTIDAHLTNIETISINNNGKLVATASERATLIRVFNTETGNKEYEFRRGSQSANIYDICFDKHSNILACTSSNGTVHFFELYNDVSKTKNTQSMFVGMKGYLPEYFGSHWGFKQVNINNMSRSICAFDEDGNLHVVTYDGGYYKMTAKEDFDRVTQGSLHINSK